MKNILPLILVIALLLSSCQNKTEQDTTVDVADAQVTEDEAIVENGEDSTAEEDVPIEKGDWTLVWHDEFDGDTVNMDNWSYDVPTNGRWNNEIQSYTENNAYIQDGHLVMEAREETIVEADGSVYNYSSSKMITQGKQTMTYGRIEVKAKLPYGQGIWPAIWMMPEDELLYGTWPVCGEIDIMENLGNEVDTIHGTIHFGEPHKQDQGTYKLDNGEAFADDYHVYTIEWEPGEIRWYIDDIQYHTANDWYSYNSNNEESYTYPAPFDQPFFLIMNISIGGGWPGNPDSSTIFPQQMLVDYVRVYDKDEYTVHEQTYVSPLVAREPLEDGNYIYNGTFLDSDFEVDLTAEGTDIVDQWTFLLGPSGVANFIATDGVLHAQIDNGGSEDWSVQVFQAPIHLEKDATYEVTFDAMADEDRTLKVKIGGDGDRGWVDYAAEAPLDITTDWMTSSFQFTMTADSDVKARFELNMGISASDLWIKNVSLVKISGPAE